MFPIQLLELWTAIKDIDSMPLPDLEDDQEVWEVEDIEAHKDTSRGRRFLVKWAGWPAEYNTWEPEENLEGAKAMLRKYLKKRRMYGKWNKPGN